MKGTQLMNGIGRGDQGCARKVTLTASVVRSCGRNNSMLIVDFFIAIAATLIIIVVVLFIVVFAGDGGRSD